MPRSKYSAGLEETRFNRTVVQAYAYRRLSGKTYTYYWFCLCDCGTWHIADARSMARTHVQSCGCLNRDGTQKAAFTHGHTRRGRESREYTSWDKMKDRTDNPKNKWFHLYGGRGIRCCRGLREFSHFLKVLGPRPENQSVDRIDNNGHYSCGECSECLINSWAMNVRWATVDEQNGNKCNTIFLTLNGRRQPLFFWAKEVGIPRVRLYRQYRRSESAALDLLESLILSVPAPGDHLDSLDHPAAKPASLDLLVYPVD